MSATPTHGLLRLMLSRFPAQGSSWARDIRNLQGKHSLLTSPLPPPPLSALLCTLSFIPFVHPGPTRHQALPRDLFEAGTELCPQHKGKQDLGSGAAGLWVGGSPGLWHREFWVLVFSCRRRRRRGFERGRLGSGREGEIPPLQGWERGLEHQVAWQWLSRVHKLL